MEKTLMEESVHDYFMDSLTEEDSKVMEYLKLKMKINDDDEEALCALYDFEIFLFNKGLKSATKTIIITE